MITNFLLDHAAFVPVVLVVIAVGCVGIGYVLSRRRHGQWITWVLVALSMPPVVALTIVPAADSRLAEVRCTVQFSVPTLGSVELLANVALFLPPVFFATLATRRPLATLAAGAGLSVAIEALQALAPAIGRACDTNDWLMNTLGAAVGVLLAIGTIAIVNRRGSRGDTAHRHQPLA
jgi:hypothetical protein